MDESPKCYLVTSGSYSDYSVNAVFLTREEAEAYRLECIEACRRVGEVGEVRWHEWNDVAEMPLGRPSGERLRDQWHARIDLVSGRMLPPRPHLNPKGMAAPSLRSDPCPIRDRRHTHLLEVDRTSYVSQEHAEKLCVESRQEWLRLKATTEAKS